MTAGFYTVEIARKYLHETLGDYESSDFLTIGIFWFLNQEEKNKAFSEAKKMAKDIHSISESLNHLVVMLGGDIENIVFEKKAGIETKKRNKKISSINLHGNKK